MQVCTYICLVPYETEVKGLFTIGSLRCHMEEWVILDVNLLLCLQEPRTVRAHARMQFLSPRIVERMK